MPQATTQKHHALLNIDLHTHSTASDGRLTPAALATAAAEAGVECLALTDHDTVAGVAAAQAQAREHGMQFVPGVEVSVSWEKRTLHIVGLGVDPHHTQLVAALAQLQHTREQRARDMGERLEKAGLQDAYPRARGLAGEGQVTRGHFARLLVEDGLCGKFQQAFQRYLKPGKPGYVDVAWSSLEEAVATIQQAGGLAVLAHPMAYGMTGAWRRRTLTAFSEAGGDGVEVCCGNHNPSDTGVCTADALHYGLLGSVGSDFHGPHQRWLALGRPLRLPPGVPPVWQHPRLARFLDAHQSGDE